MKGILIKSVYLLTLIIPTFGYAQTLENRYSNLTTNYFKFSSTEDGYVEYDQKSNIIRVLDLNHQVLKSLQLTSSVSVYLVSKTIVNNDGKFKFVIASSSLKNVSIIDEDNNVLFKRDSASIAKFINTSNGPKMLLLSTSGSWTEVYSIPGSIFLKTSNPDRNSYSLEIYPNPTSLKTSVRINSDKHEGKFVDVTIISLEGLVVHTTKSQIINGEISIDLNGMSSGEYFLKLDSINLNSIYEKVIVN